MAKFLLIFNILIFIILQLNAQDTVRQQLGDYPVDAVVQNGDTVYVAKLEEVVIQPRKRIASTRDLRQYRRLIYNIKKVYPYAKIAGQKFGEISAQLQTFKSGKEQREYIKLMEADIIKQYEEELKNLTVTQGRILIKLIDRETSKTSYEVVKELRGSFQAAFWQAIARIFGSNLKTEFDPEGEDKIIEEIMVMIEKGQL